MDLVEITETDYDVDIVMIYATPDNLLGRPVYAHKGCYLHPDAASALKRTVALARPLGLRLRLYDAYRPPEVQEMFWAAVKGDATFVADPSRGSPHSRGVAVDLNLVDADGNELDMGTGVDAMTPLSYHGDTEIPVEAQRNRFVLLGLMTAAGWTHYPLEWWHYQLPNDVGYPLLSNAASGVELLAPA